MTVIAILPHLWIVPITALIPAGLAVLWFWIASHYRENWWSVAWHNKRQKPAHDDSYSGDEGSGYAMGGWIWVGVAVVMLVIEAVLLIPFQSKYHVFYRLEGTVTDVTNSFDDGSGKLTHTTVAHISGYDQPVVVNDARIMTLVGKDVDLTCTISWVPYGLDETDCGVAGVTR